MSLSPAARLDNSVLTDISLGAAHAVEEPGQQLLSALHKGATLYDLEQRAAVLHLKHGQLAALLGFLNLAGLLRRKRKYSKWPEVWVRQLWGVCTGIYYAPLSHREIVSVKVLLLAILRACFLLFLATAGLVLLLIGAGVPAIPTTNIAMYGLVLFISSLYLHEVAHIFIIKQQGYNPVLLQRGVRLGILHPALGPKEEMRCALLGPAVGCLTGLGAALISVAAGYTVHALIASTVAAFHAGSLLPWYGDGASVRKAIAQRSKT